MALIDRDREREPYRSWDAFCWEWLAREHAQAIADLNYLIDIGLKQLESGGPMPPKRVHIDTAPFGGAPFRVE